MELTRDERDVLQVMGYVYLRNGKDEKALALFEGLEAIDPGDAHTERSLAYVHLRAGRAEEALAAAQKALAIAPKAPENWTMHLVRSRALLALDRSDESRAAAAAFLTFRREHDNG
ncbi:MAG: tetratricopeptide repeat protein [Desulfovibrionaceae bacterium]|jgi:tetratricopeptide (TPR) repeat protein|nr:tetratricopeptide repeat protein [Desulfovibrionaceae bacterium]